MGLIIGVNPGWPVPRTGTTMTSRSSNLAIGWVEQGLVPDRVVRLGIRRLLKERLVEIGDADAERSNEIAEAFDWQVPDWCILPVCYGDALYGMWKGFEDLKALGWIDRTPRFVAAEVSGSPAAPMARGAAMPPAAPRNAPRSATSIGAPTAHAPAPALAGHAASGQDLHAVPKRAEAAAHAAGAPTTTASIQLQTWPPDSPYAARLSSAATTDMYRIYLDEKPGYLNSTAFFLDAADLFFEKGLNDFGVRILSNLAEMDLENRHILRILGYRLVQAGQPQIAIGVFKKVLVLSPEEPQSYRDLGLAYAADKQSQQAINTLYEVVIRPWHGRFPEIELITLADLNSVVATAKETLDVSRIDPRLLKNLPLDLRVVLTWDADNTDIDLHVTDPDGERASFGHRLTHQGGSMSLDSNGGSGPDAV